MMKMKKTMLVLAGAAAIQTLCFLHPMTARAEGRWVGNGKIQVWVEDYAPYAQAETKEKLYALEEKYPEGYPWSNDDEYDFVTLPYYDWGCLGFADTVEDALYGETASYGIDRKFDWESIRIGDHIRMNQWDVVHSVIVLEKNDERIKVLEGNFGGIVHWGRRIPKDELEAAFVYREYCEDKESGDNRYPQRLEQ